MATNTKQTKANTAKADKVADKAGTDTSAKAANVQRSNAAMDTIIADIRSTIAASLSRETQNIKATQQIAWDIMQYRAIQIADGVKVVTWQALNDMDSSALTKWRSAMADVFIGKRPSVKGDKSQATTDATADYNKKRTLLDTACNFAVAIGIHGVTDKHFLEAHGCFGVPVAAMLPKDDKWVPKYTLAEAFNNSSLIPLDNHGYTIEVGTAKSRTIYASVKHIVDCWKSKAPVATTTTVTTTTTNADGTTTTTTAPAPAKGASDTGTLDPKTIAVVFKNASVDRLVTGLTDALNRDPKLPMKADDFEPETWNRMLNLAARINAMAATKADLDKTKPTNGKTNDKTANKSA